MPSIAVVVAWDRSAQPAIEVDELTAALAPFSTEPARVARAPGALLAGVGEPPLVDERAGAGMVADCRLDNRDELVARLGIGGGSSDAALLLEAYRAWGDDMAAHLVGDFAGVVWDWERRRVVGFRDALGAKPLHWGPCAGGLAVASDVETLARLTRARFVPDDHLIVEHLTWEYHSTERTFWAGLRRLHGGHVLVATAADARARRYWFPPSHDFRASSRAAAYERFRGLFFDSVKRRLRSDRPVLAHLSGGVDSSLIVCAADRIARTEGASQALITAVSARYPGLACDEGPYIEAVTRAVRLPAQSWDGLDADFPDLDAPSLAGPGMRSHRNDGSVGEFTIAARLGARAILSGQGGDHLGGPFGLSEEKARRRPLAYLMGAVAGRELTRAQRLNRARLMLRLLVPAPARALAASRRARSAAPAWLQPRWRELVGALAAERYAAPGRPLHSAVEEAHWRELTSARLGRALDLDQRCAAGHGLEMRFPYLDQDLVGFVLSLPVDYWPRALAHVRLHREALGDLLPEAVRSRTTKAAFSPVLAHRLRRAETRLRTLFFEGEWACAPWVERRPAQQLFERAFAKESESESENAAGAFSVWHPVWAIATLEAWLRGCLRYDAASKETR